MNNKNYYPEACEQIKKSVESFKQKQLIWTQTINNATNNYTKDFSVLLKQNIFDTFMDIHKSKEEILTEILILINFSNTLSGIEFETAENLRINALKISSINYSSSILDYGKEINTFISFMKTAEGKIYKNQLDKSKSVINIWIKCLKETQEIYSYIDKISYIVNK